MFCVLFLFKKESKSHEFSCGFSPGCQELTDTSWDEEQSLGPLVLTNQSHSTPVFLSCFFRRTALCVYNLLVKEVNLSLYATNQKKHINENCVSVFASFGKKDLLGMPKLRVLNTMGIKSLDIHHIVDGAKCHRKNKSKSIEPRQVG